MSLLDRIDNRIIALENEIEYLRYIIDYDEQRRYYESMRMLRRPYPRHTPFHDLRYRPNHNTTGVSSLFNQRMSNLFNLNNLGNLNNTGPIPNQNLNTNRNHINTDNINNTTNTHNINNTNNTSQNRFSNFSRLFQNIIPDLVEVSFVDSEGRPINRQSLNNSISLQNLRSQTTIELIEESENDNEETNICTICRNELTIGEVVRKINSCGHKFHIECIDRWFEEHNQCPTCRHDLNRTEV